MMILSSAFGVFLFIPCAAAHRGRWACRHPADPKGRASSDC